MRKLGSILTILIFLTAYGRCVADQFGILHTSEDNGCQSSCNHSDHCADADDQQHHDSDAGNPQPEQAPASPCQLCCILSNDSIQIDDSIKVPTPTFQVITPIYHDGHLEDLRLHPLRHLYPDFQDPPPEFPDPPAESRSRLQRIAAKVTPVRGPSLV